MDGGAMSEKRTVDHKGICGLVAKPCLKGAAGRRESLWSGGGAMPERSSGAQGKTCGLAVKLYPEV